MSAAIKLERTCQTCTKRDTARCEAKKEGYIPGPQDWCMGYRAKKVNIANLTADCAEGVAVEGMS